MSVPATSAALIPSQRDAIEIRRLIFELLQHAGSGHAGGPFGMADVFAVLYRDLLSHRPKQPTWEARDRVILSNGHICPVLYATLALHGYFPTEWLSEVRHLGGRLQGHPERDESIGIETTSGPLGQGLSQAVGVALGLRLREQSRSHVYALLSDGEHQEGQTWEAYQSGAKYGLDNLTVVIDRNFIQISGITEQIMPIESLPAKLTSFGWSVFEVDGHDHAALRQALLNAKEDGVPSVVLAYTTPGKGIAEIERKFTWHGYTPDVLDPAATIRELNTLQGSLQGEYA